MKASKAAGSRENAMTETTLWAPPAVPSLPVKGQAALAPFNRIFCVGRNYLAHAAEMGHTIEKSGDRPFYFIKSPQDVAQSDATIPYPPETANFHHEMELVVVIGAPGFRVPSNRAHELVFGYACGLDMTRRDLQLAAREEGRPWDLGKNFENAAVVSEVAPMPGGYLEHGAIALAVNGVVKQSSDLDRMIWSVREIISDLSLFYHPFRATSSSPARPKASARSSRATGWMGGSRAWAQSP
jgi:fumarylpyruvate hydrolase